MEIVNGQVWYTYTSKLSRSHDLTEAAKKLVDSDTFVFTFRDNGELFYKSNKKIEFSNLSYKLNATGTGMTMTGHSEFMNSGQSKHTYIAFWKTIELKLSRLRLFSEGFGFPEDFIRAFMNPIFIRIGADEEYRIFVPYINLYASGLIQTTLIPMNESEGEDLYPFITDSVNLATRSITSVLATKAYTKELLRLDFDCSGTLKKLKEIKYFLKLDKSIKSFEQVFDTGIEKITVYEHVLGPSILLSDVCLSIMDACGNILTRHKTVTPEYWFQKAVIPVFRSGTWRGKPCVYIQEHTNQKNLSTENLEHNKTLIQSVMTRCVLKDGGDASTNNLIDLRLLNDYSHFHSFGVSLSLLSESGLEALKTLKSFTFDNIIADCQVKTEIADYINSSYEAFIDAIGHCNSNSALSHLSLELMLFEERMILSCSNSGEIAHFISTLKKEETIKNNLSILNGKITSTDKLLDLTDRISKEQINKTLTILFGVIASATLSPELIQPAVKSIGIESINASDFEMPLKAICTAAALVIVFVIVWFVSKRK
jgi:hypothetical protein